MMKPVFCRSAWAGVCACLLAVPAHARDTSVDELIAGYSAEAGVPADAEQGKALFLGTHSGGKPDTPSCTTCHTQDPTAVGEARTGKRIEPLAPSANQQRFTTKKTVEKWFGRNCTSVLGRACTAAEKANVIAWLKAL